jgi:hypothetical protein
MISSGDLYQHVPTLSVKKPCNMQKIYIQHVWYKKQNISVTSVLEFVEVRSKQIVNRPSIVNRYDRSLKHRETSKSL